METRTIKPAPGRRIRRPDAGFTLLPDEGCLVGWSSYWERLLSDGDVVVVIDADASKPAGKAKGADQ